VRRLHARKAFSPTRFERAVSELSFGSKRAERALVSVCLDYALPYLLKSEPPTTKAVYSCGSST